MRPHHHVIAVLVAAVTIAGSAASAEAGRRARPKQPTQPAGPNFTAAEEAQRLLLRGVEHYSEGRYVDAIEAFRRSNALLPSPKVRVNLALALWKQGDAVAAARELELLLADRANPLPVVERARVLLADVTKDLGRIDLEVRGTGVVWLDGRRHGTAPLIETLWVTPGAHEIRIARQQRRVTTRPGQPARAQLDAAPPDPVPISITQPVSAQRGERKHWRWIVPATATSVALAAAVGFGLAADADEQKLQDLNRDSASHDYSLAASTAERGQRRALFANISFAVAAAGAVTVTWVLFNDRRDGVEVGFGGSYAYARGTF